MVDDAIRIGFNKTLKNKFLKADICTYSKLVERMFNDYANAYQLDMDGASNDLLMFERKKNETFRAALRRWNVLRDETEFHEALPESRTLGARLMLGMKFDASEKI